MLQSWEYCWELRTQTYKMQRQTNNTPPQKKPQKTKTQTFGKYHLSTFLPCFFSFVLMREKRGWGVQGNFYSGIKLTTERRCCKAVTRRQVPVEPRMVCSVTLSLLSQHSVTLSPHTCPFQLYRELTPPSEVQLSPTSPVVQNTCWGPARWPSG